MSYKASAWALEQNTGTPWRKAVLNMLAYRAGDFGECYPSQGTLAADLEMSVDTIARRLVELADAGFIRRFGRTQRSGARTSDMIVVLHNEVAAEFADALANSQDIDATLKEWAACGGNPSRRERGGRPKAEKQAPAPEREAPQPSAETPTAVGRDHESSLKSQKNDDAEGAKPKIKPRELEEKLREAAGEDVLNSASPNIMVMAEPLRWMQQGADLELDILPTVRAVGERVRQRPLAFNRKIGGWAFFTQDVMGAYRQRMEEIPQSTTPYHGANHGNRGARRTTGDAARDLDAKIKGGATLPARPAF